MKSPVHLLLCLLVQGLISAESFAQVDVLVDKIVQSAGGKEQLPRIFRLEEELNVSADLQKPGNPRVSVIDVPDHWWVNKKDRVVIEKEPAINLVWAWTLQILLSESAKMEMLGDTTVEQDSCVGVRLSGAVEPPMDLYFTKDKYRLRRIDWRQDVHLFSEWEESDGYTYASRTVGLKKATQKPWYTTKIKKFEKLKSVPADIEKK